MTLRHKAHFNTSGQDFKKDPRFAINAKDSIDSE